MDFNKLIQERRSIRNYDDTQNITKEMIDEIIYAAIQAPSWKNSQTGRYYCIIDEENIKSFSEKCLPEFNQSNSQGAAAIIVTAFVHNISGYEKSGEPTNELGNGWGCYDLGLQNENLILKAKDMGLDTLIMGIRNTAEIKNMLNIPDTQTVVSVIALGYAKAEAKKPERKPIEEVIKYF